MSTESRRPKNLSIVVPVELLEKLAAEATTIELVRQIEALITAAEEALR